MSRTLKIIAGYGHQPKNMSRSFPYPISLAPSHTMQTYTAIPTTSPVTNIAIRTRHDPMLPRGLNVVAAPVEDVALAELVWDPLAIERPAVI